MNNVADRGTHLTTALEQLKTAFDAAGDAVNARKLKQLIDKSADERLYIAFCGHFSAGKSSMINKLCGHPLLPSSPIPTSANIVSITNGAAEARITRRLAETDAVQAGAQAIVESIPLEQLGEYARNGTEIEAVEIRYPIPLLEYAVLLDTPGIDSTDDAHHMATESALHLADVVFYVMDYNHVQSEINFAFTKQMKDRGKPLFLIVNMIDKHREQELSFDEYRDSALQAFRNWHIEPDGVLYTSVKREEHPNNEWNRLLWTLRQLIAHAPELSAFSVHQSAAHLVEEHAKLMAERQADVKAALRERLAEEGLDEVQSEFEKERAKLNELLALPEQLEAAMRKDALAVIENANIIPAPTRDLAHDYLQSRKPGFKVGFFSRASQTAAEIEKRLLALHRDFSEKVGTQIAWHVRDAVRKRWEENGFPADEAIAAADSIQVELTPQWLADQVSMAAGFTGEYTLNYSRDIAAEAKSLYRKRAYEAIEQLRLLAAERLAEGAASAEQRLAALEAQLGAVRELERLAREDAAYRERLLAALASAPLAPALPDAAAYRAAA
ncbi:dynamin family protein, partial [Paenibacillus thalictri]